MAANGALPAPLSSSSRAKVVGFGAREVEYRYRFPYQSHTGIERYRSRMEVRAPESPWEAFPLIVYGGCNQTDSGRRDRGLPGYGKLGWGSKVEYMV
jgi:hypothetical protein